MKKILLCVASTLATLFVVPAFAHHPLGGLPMETFSHGMLSGVGHPLLGFDHLFFVLLMGVAAAFTANRFLSPLAYIISMLVGCLVTAMWTTLPAVELVVALSLLVLGSMLLSGRQFSGTSLLVVFALFGLFHGGAFGASIATQESGLALPVLVGYLIGLGVIQYVLAFISGTVCTSAWKASSMATLQPRLAGAMVAGVGLFLVLEHAEGPLLQLIVG